MQSLPEHFHWKRNTTAWGTCLLLANREWHSIYVCISINSIRKEAAAMYFFNLRRIIIKDCLGIYFIVFFFPFQLSSAVPGLFIWISNKEGSIFLGFPWALLCSRQEFSFLKFHNINIILHCKMDWKKISLGVSCALWVAICKYFALNLRTGSVMNRPPCSSVGSRSLNTPTGYHGVRKF